MVNPMPCYSHHGELASCCHQNGARLSEPRVAIKGSISLYQLSLGYPLVNVYIHNYGKIHPAISG